MTRKNEETSDPAIRETTQDDRDAVLGLYPQAFPDEELRPVVSALLDGPYEILSLAAFDGGAMLGHVLFTLCGMQEGSHNAALLAPLGVVPPRHGQGLGTALVRDGLVRLESRGIDQIFVLGDPAYYGRFGFQPERQVQTPCDIPAEWAEAWQSKSLAADMPTRSGRLLLPEPWMQPELWSA